MRQSFRVLAFYCVVPLAAIFLMTAFANPVQSAALIYKSYVVRKDRGRDILCTPYIVQKNDYIIKLFRERGEIAHADFPEFLLIFSRLNPQIRNADLIQPGEHILIPLKKIAPNSLPDQERGIVTIPFVSLSAVPDLPQPPPDTRSSLQKTADLLEAQLIEKGTYFFPRPGENDLKLDLSQYPILEFSGAVRVMFAPLAAGSAAAVALAAPEVAAIKSFWKNLTLLPLDRNAATEQILDAILKEIGNIQANENVSFSDGGVRVSVSARWWYETIGQNTGPRKIGIFPMNVDNASFPPALLTFLREHGIFLKPISGSFSKGIYAYREPITISQDKIIEIAKPEAFVSSLLASLRISYAPSVAITFPYGNIQIPAVSNLIDSQDGGSILVDFGSLYGDAVASIENYGIRVIRISPQDSKRHIIEKILSGMGLLFQSDPVFTELPLKMAYGAEISIPGYLVSKRDSAQTLLSMVPLAPSLVRFLIEKGLDIIQIASPSTES